MAELVVLIGIPGSGKTSFFERTFAATHQVVSKDLLRNHRRPATRQLDLLERALESGASVVVDNTNASREERAALIALGRHRLLFRMHGARMPGAQCRPRGPRARSARRDLRHAKSLELPSVSEGFDALYLVRPQPEQSFEVLRLE
jgi:predicted kinase